MLAPDIVKPKESILTSFANVQLAGVKRDRAKENLLLELVISAFFHGAVKKLDKQSELDLQDNRDCLIGLIMRTCSIPETTAAIVLDSMDEMARQHCLIENIIQKGSDVAELWLACETSGDDMLYNLVEQYRGHTMHEFGISGVSTRYEAQQKLLALSLDESVSRVYRRTKIILFFVLALSVCGIGAAYWFLYLQ